VAAQGTTTVNFGAFPGSTDTSVTITGQTGILAGSLVEAWIFPTATADHTADEHWVDPPEVYAGNVVAGTGFTIYAVVKKRADIGPVSDSLRIRNVDAPMTYGLWTVGWVWN
jgi:hypothetical protein